MNLYFVYQAGEDDSAVYIPKLTALSAPKIIAAFPTRAAAINYALRMAVKGETATVVVEREFSIKSGDVNNLISKSEWEVVFVPPKESEPETPPLEPDHWEPLKFSDFGDDLLNVEEFKIWLNRGERKIRLVFKAEAAQGFNPGVSGQPTGAVLDAPPEIIALMAGIKIAFTNSHDVPVEMGFDESGEVYLWTFALGGENYDADEIVNY